MRGCAAVAALVLVGAGCAGASGSSGLGGAASVVPADAVAFVAVHTDLSSKQARAVDAVLRVLPARDPLLVRVRRALSRPDETRAALGPELDLVALRGSPPQLVALVRPDDAKLKALLGTPGDRLTARRVGDWTALASGASALAALEHVHAPLADSSAYRSAMSALSSGALARAYANGARTQRFLAALPGQVAAAPPPVRGGFRPGSSTFATERLAWGAVDLVSVHGGLRLQAFTRGSPPSEHAVQHARLVQLRTDAYAPLLLDEMPAGAVFALDYQAASGAFENADPASLPAWLRRLTTVSTLLPYDLDSLLGGETAIYIRTSAPAPELTLVTQPRDVERALDALPDLQSELRPAFPLLARVELHHAVIGGQLVVSTSAAGIAAFRSRGPRLRDDPAFRAAAKSAGMPQQTTGFVYANAAGAPPLLRTLLRGAGAGGLLGFSPVAGYGTHTGADSSYTLYLGTG